MLFTGTESLIIKLGAAANAVLTVTPSGTVAAGSYKIFFRDRYTNQCGFTDPLDPMTHMEKESSLFESIHKTVCLLSMIQCMEWEVTATLELQDAIFPHIPVTSGTNPPNMYILRGLTFFAMRCLFKLGGFSPFGNN
jgi:hypothetical protein